LILEWLAHAAMHENPGLIFQGVDDLRILKGITFGPKESVTIQVLTGPAVSRDGTEIVPVEMRCEGLVRARASVILSSQLATGMAHAAPPADQPYSGAGNLYGDGRLFHGNALHGLKAVLGWSDQGIIADAAAAPAASVWLRQPLRSAWLSDPLALDAAFQLMILWSFEARGIGSLPTAIGRYRQFTRAFPPTGTRIQIRVTQATEHAEIGRASCR